MSLHALLVAHDIAPVALPLARALVGTGVEPIVVTPYSPALAHLGLARRVDPVRLGDHELTLHEGPLPGGRGQLLAVEPPAGDSGIHAAVHAGLQLHPGPAIMHVFAGAELAPPAPAGCAVIYDLVNPTAVDTLPAPLHHVIVGAPGAAAAARAALAAARGEAGAPPVTGILRGCDPISAAAGQQRADRKRRAQQLLGLPERASTPLFAVPGPFDRALLDRLQVPTGAQLGFLVDETRDAGERAIVDALVRPERAAVHAASGRDHADAVRRVLGGADFVLYAHRYDLAGPTELGWLHYGCAPVAPRGVGYDDAFVEFEASTATGTAFLYQEGHLEDALRRGAQAFRSESFATLVERCRDFDLSWRTTALRYLDVYEATIASLAGSEAA